MMARKLATTEGKAAGQRPAESVHLLKLRVGPFCLCLRTGPIRGLVDGGEIVSVARETGLRGLAWWDGALLPVTDLAPLLRLPEAATTSGKHGVVVGCGDGAICFMVDEVLDLVEVPVDAVMVLPAMVSRAVAVPGIDSVVLLDRAVLVVDPIEMLGEDGIKGLLKAVVKAGGQDGAATELGLGDG